MAGAAAATDDDDPTPEVLEATLRELLRRSRLPEFRGRFGRCLAAAGGGGASAADGRGQLSELLSELQAPVLEHFGFPADAGAEIVRHAVHRRIVEGHQSLEMLALEARQLIDVSEWPDPELEAEEFLASKVDETIARCDGGDLKRRCDDLVAKEAGAGEVPAHIISYLRRLLEDGSTPVPPIMSLLVMAKIGAPLGLLCDSGSSSASSVPVLDAPPAGDLFQSHVLPSRPAVLRGCLDACSFPPLRDFPDFAWLRANCGHRRVPVKSYMHDDQQGRAVFLGDPELRLPMCALLDAVEAHELSNAKVPFYLGKVPLRAELPEMADHVEAASSCPRRLYGECFGELKPEGSFTYFGCGRNTTPVHFDAHENLLLCVCGTKRLWLYPPADARYLYPVNDFTRSAVLPFVAPADLPEDLRETYEEVRHARPIEVTLGPGDVLYLPACWWHSVEGSEDRNMVLNWWFKVHPEKRALAGDQGAHSEG